MTKPTQTQWKVVKVSLKHFMCSWDTLLVVEISTTGDHLTFIPSASEVLSQIEGEYKGEKRTVTVNTTTHHLLHNNQLGDVSPETTAVMAFRENNWEAHFDPAWWSNVHAAERVFGN